jgi:hypothetical protein
VIYTAAPLFLPGSFDPLTIRLDLVPGDKEVIVPGPRRLLPPKRRARDAADDRDDDIGRLTHFVERVPAGARNNALYWAARRAGEKHRTDTAAAAEFHNSAVRAGLSAAEAAATILSALRHG